MPREVKMDLAKEEVPLTMGQPAFKTKTGWVNDDAGLLTVVSSMMEEAILPPVKAVIRKQVRYQTVWLAHLRHQSVARLEVFQK